MKVKAKTCVYLAEPTCNASNDAEGDSSLERTETRRRNEC
jgi:hypothetical protein